VRLSTATQAPSTRYERVEYPNIACRRLDLPRAADIASEPAETKETANGNFHQNCSTKGRIDLICAGKAISKNAVVRATKVKAQSAFFTSGADSDKKYTAYRAQISIMTLFVS
jgi:hypothetical protein